jgi:hypothetical protein
MSQAAWGGVIGQENCGAGLWPTSEAPGRLHHKDRFTGIQREADVDEVSKAVLLETTGKTKADGCSRSW